MQHYPDKLNVAAARGPVIDLFKAENPSSYVEVGVYEGHTAQHILKEMQPGGMMFLLDFKEKYPAVSDALKQVPRDDVEIHFIGNTDALYDSYNWSLSLMIDRGVKLDFAFIDGAHTLALDGLAFALVDVMLQPGGVVCFDDDGWTLDKSPSLNSRVYPATGGQYTPEQQIDNQVGRIMRQLVRSRDDYEEIIPNFAFRKR